MSELRKWCLKDWTPQSNLTFHTTSDPFEDFVSYVETIIVKS